LEYGSGINFNGAVRVEGKSPFDNSNPFIDLHLNFPAYMGKYEMGMTPFMSAVSQVSLGDHQLHNARLNALNAGVKSVPFSKIL